MLRHMYRKKEAQRKKLRDASYVDIEMGIDICLVFFNTTYPWPVVVYSFGCRSCCTFWRKKYQKLRHSEKIVTSALCSCHHRWAFGRALACHSRLSLVCRVLRTLISAAILKIIYTRANLQTCLAQWPANKRPCIGFFNGAVSLSATDYLC